MLTQDTEMKAHQWVEAAAVAVAEDTAVLTEATVRMDAEAEAAAEALVDAAAVAATIGDSIEAVEVDHEDEEAWGRSFGQVQPGQMHGDVLPCRK